MSMMRLFPSIEIERPEVSGQVRQIALYGKGGIGKSTTASNLSAALAQKGHKVLQMGCDPKADSVTNLVGGRFIPTILEREREIGHDPELLNELLVEGFGGVLCAESGGPLPGQGCAGRGVLVALEMLTASEILAAHGINFAVYDVLGDVVCGGFAQPLRKGYASEVYLVTSAETMSLYAANNISRAISNLAKERAAVRLAGIIHNRRNVVNEIELVEEFAAKLGSRVIIHIPRDEAVQVAESEGKTVIEALPDSAQAKVYLQLAEYIAGEPNKVIPTPYEAPEDIRRLVKKYQRTGAAVGV